MEREFDKNQFKELSKMLTAKKYSCCFYPCSAHGFTEVTFNKDYNFEGLVNSFKEVKMVKEDNEVVGENVDSDSDQEYEKEYDEINEYLKRKTFDCVRISSYKEYTNDKINLDVDLMTMDPRSKIYHTVNAKLLLTQAQYDEISDNCMSYGKITRNKCSNCGHPADT